MEKTTKEKIETIRQQLIESRKEEAHWFDKLKPWQKWIVLTLMIPGGIIAIIACYVLSYLFVWLIENQ